jgi:uncharacterized protein
LYTHMQRSNRHFLFFLVGFYILWTFRATWFYSRVDLSIPDAGWRLVFSLVIKFLLWVIPAVAYIHWHDRQDPWQVMRIKSPIKRQGLLLAAMISIAYLAGIIVYEYLSTGRTLLPLHHAAALPLVGTLASISLSALTEELFFRGFVLPELNKNGRFGVSNLLQALLFVGIHWPNWLWTGRFQWGLVSTSVSILLLALLLGWLVRRTNSIWPAVVVHSLNNLIAAFLG